MKIKGRVIVPGSAEGEVFFTDHPITFYGGVDMKTGKIVQSDHPRKGESITGKILVFPYGVGSTVGSYVIYGMKKYGTAPKAIVLQRVDTVVAAGVLLADIPTVDQIDIEKLRNTKKVRVIDGIVEVLE